MSGLDAELDHLRNHAKCAAVLEQFGTGWHLDKRESTRNARKYRRGAGEIIIVNHDGRGWWDPQSAAKGDVFDLVQHLDPSLNFGQVRQALRRVVSIASSSQETPRQDDITPDEIPVGERWIARPRLRRGSPGWVYLAEVRFLPRSVLAAATTQDAVREGFRGSAWFAHRDRGAVVHVEVRGPAFKGSLRGGRKTLFRFGRAGQGTRLAVAEAPIDALSLAAIEGTRSDTLYLATGGGMGPGTVAALAAELRTIAAFPKALLASAADANPAGERYAAHHHGLAAAAGVRFERLTPPRGEDWNDTLRIEGRR